MLESTGRSSVGVGRRHPIIILMVSFSVTSSFFTWELLHHAGMHIPQRYRPVLVCWIVRWKYWRLMMIRPDGVAGCF